MLHGRPGLTAPTKRTTDEGGHEVMRKEETGEDGGLSRSGRTIHNMSWQAAGDSGVLGEINAATARRS